MIHPQGTILARPDTIAIDGPVASGKTTVGRLISRKLDYRFLDTGIMYRAVTWMALEQGVDLDDGGALGRLAREADISLPSQSGAVIISGREVAEELRHPRVDRTVSLVSASAHVRTALVDQQRKIAEGGRIVVVGRDIGTVVLPLAELKLFLLATVEERARRRHLELKERGQGMEYERVLEDLRARDELDTQREHSPLRPADDALLLDTDSMGMEQVMEKVQDLIG